MFTFMELMPIHIFKYRPRLDLDTLTLYPSMAFIVEYKNLGASPPLTLFPKYHGMLW